MRRLLVLLATLGVVVGCSSPIAGTPSPPTTPPGLTSQSAPPVEVPEKTGIRLPPRPRELRLDTAKPCNLLSLTQRSKLGLDGDPVTNTSNSAPFIGPTCSIRGFEPKSISVGIAFATRQGIEAITTPGAVDEELSPIKVADFPAVIARPRLTNFCSVDVDVAEGQFLDILFRDVGENPPISQDQLCDGAVAVAKQAVTTLGSS